MQLLLLCALFIQGYSVGLQLHMGNVGFALIGIFGALPLAFSLWRRCIR